MPVYRKVEDKLPLMTKNQNLKKNAFAFEHLWLDHRCSGGPDIAEFID